MTSRPPVAPIVVGFDLDMTLFDTRLSIAATLRATAETLDVPFDVEKFMADLGPPLDVMAARQLPADRVAGFVAHYRAVYRDHGVAAARLLPGARESIAAVRRHGGSTIVVTGKNDGDAGRHIRHEALDVDHVIGLAWADVKAEALSRHAAFAYVGDHPADIAAARSAGAHAVAVTTGTHDADAFPDADVVLDSLERFPAWLDGVRRA